MPANLPIPPAPPLAVLLTDFGEQDWFVGSMKAAILKRCPRATIVDLCHAIQPGSIRQGAWVLAQTFAEFPRGTAFCLVIDPGVGGSRRELAARSDNYIFFAPDNGLLSGVREQSQIWECYTIENPEWMNKQVSNTFHGRDIFASATGAFLSGRNLAEVGKRSENMVNIELPCAEKTGEGRVRASIVHIDRFGNLLTDLSKDEFSAWGGSTGVICRIRDVEITSIKRTFSDSPEGELLAYWGSLGFLEIGLNGGSAARMLDTQHGDIVEITL